MKNYFLIFSIFIFLFNCKETPSLDGNKNEKLNVSKNTILVDVEIIKEQKFNKQIISNGLVESKFKSELRFKTSEHLTKINVKNGQKVNKGQVLAQLDNEVILNQLNKAKIDLAKAETKLQEEKINYGLGSQEDSSINSYVLRNLHIKSGYLEAKNALENAQLLYEQTFLKSPISGVVANIEAKTGDFITSNDVFCTIVNQSSMEAVFSVSENDLNFVKMGQSIDINPFSDINKTYKGKVTEINPIVDENGLIQVKAQINGTNNGLFDGINAKIVINQPLDNVIVVPKVALVLRSNREVVFTVEKGLAKWNYVKIADENSTSYAINEGVKIGDTIIVSGNMNLSHDARVNPTFLSEQDNN